MSIAALLTIDKMWQQTKCSSTDEWKQKMCIKNCSSFLLTFTSPPFTRHPQKHYLAIIGTALLLFKLKKNSPQKFC